MTTSGGNATDAAPRPSRLRRPMRALAAVALAGVAVPVATRLLGWEPGPLAIVVALMPWVTLAALLTVLLSVLARAPWLTATSAVVAALCVAWQVPLFVGETAPAGDEEIIVASVNMSFGRASADDVVRLVDDVNVDVLSAQEVTPEAVEALAAAGLDELLPYSEVAAEPGVTGTGLWSRSPLIAAESLDGFTGPHSRDGYVSRAVRGEIDIAGGAVTVLAVHPAAPGLFDHSGWDASMSSLTAYLEAQSDPMLVIGDFNTTRDHRAFRDIESLGYVDAADQAGAGFLPTFPQERGPHPVAAIDHVMVRDAPLNAVDVRTVSVDGADHRALVVTYATR
ncbi:endonuclease/exonuclease/phosphatase family protein [Demequina sp. SO4-13]|uniref:endonuclease/exonuclease/phosphatase family protein n=1 Tax=Demequina sp. SO4-13 TaxID=3401027 RepID=UPI003AF680AB